MALHKWDPFGDFGQVDRIANSLWGRRDTVFPRPTAAGWSIPLDVVQGDEAMTITASMPGLAAEDVDITIDDGVLTIAAETASESEDTDVGYVVRERRFGKFHRAIRLPDTVDPQRAESAYAEGLVTITLPKIEAKKARKLEVKAA